MGCNELLNGLDMYKKVNNQIFVLSEYSVFK